MAFGDLKVNVTELIVKASLESIAMRLQKVCDGMRAETQRLMLNDAFGVSEVPGIAVLASGRSIMWGAWGVQIAVYDRGNSCLVVLTALGDSVAMKATAAMAGSKQLLANSYSLSGSKKKQDEIVAALR
jgi:hypothetical protein